MANEVNVYPQCVEAIEHLHYIGYTPAPRLGDEIVKTAGQKLVEIIRKTTPAPLFSLGDQAHLCERCQREINRLFNEMKRWPNDISGYPGDATPAREEDEFGPITSRSRWLTPGSSTDYR